MPKYLVCGGYRCGASLLCRALAKHPAVLAPRLYSSLDYFDVNYDRGIDWYRAHFPTHRAIARTSAAADSAATTFEASPHYLYNPIAAERFARDLPGVKIIVCVRDPVMRARSQHTHEVASGREPLTDFGEALSAEVTGFDHGRWAPRQRNSHGESQLGYRQAYRAAGHYAQHLERISSIVPAQRIKVVDIGRFLSEPEKVFDDVVQFLGLTSVGAPIARAVTAKLRPHAAQRRRLDNELSDYFATHDEQLFEWLGETPSWRR